ncbi:MAG: hypothetical protein ACLTCI_09650 [[Clostridium] nexile]
MQMYNIMLLVGAGLIEEEEDELRTRISMRSKEKEQGQATSEENG